MFLLSIGAMYDNVRRADMRAQCRLAAADAEGYLVLTMGNESSAVTPAMEQQVEARLGFKPAECGWTGLNIRPFPKSDENDEMAVYQSNADAYLLRTSMGGCQEYSALDGFDRSASDILEHIKSVSNSSSDKYLSCMQPQGPATPPECKELMIQTPNANYCFGSDQTSDTARISAWLQFGSLMVFLAYLVWLRWDVCRMSRVDDAKVISTADYAVQISGLDRELEADELLGRLQDELEEIDGGSFAGKVHHIEVGRHCLDENKVIEEMKRLDIEAEELHERKLSFIAKQERDKLAKVDGELRKLKERYDTNKKKLEKLIEEPDKATGHAFVVFHYARDRDRFALLFTSSARNLYMFFHPEMRRESSATLKCAEPRKEDVFTCAELLDPFFWLRLLKGLKRPQRPAVLVDSAPEPNEVLWENLALDEEWEARVESQGNFSVIVCVAAGVVILVGIKSVQVWFNALLERRRDMWQRTAGEGGMPPMLTMFLSTCMTVLVSLVTMIVNFISREVILRSTRKAGHDTLTRLQGSIFSNVSVAYIFNSAVIPFLLGLLLTFTVSWRDGDDSPAQFVDQSWYESGSVVSTAAMLIWLNWITDLLKVVNPTPIVQQLWYARYAHSESKKKELCQPVPFNEGLQYAITIKSVALGLVYGPIWPMAYLYTSLGLVLSWWCTRIGLREWYKFPANVQADMMMLMRWRLGNVLGLAIMVQFLAMYYATNVDGPGFGATSSALVVAPLAVGVYVLLPLGLIKDFTVHDEVYSSQTAEERETGGLRFDDVTEARGFEMPRYKCPLVSAADLTLSRNTHARSLGVAKYERSLGHQASFILKVEGLKQDSMFDHEEDGAVGSHITSEILERAHSSRKRRSKPHKVSIGSPTRAPDLAAQSSASSGASELGGDEPQSVVPQGSARMSNGLD